VLFRTTQAIAKYQGSVIPLAILSVVALSEKEQYFKRIEIWHDEEVPDPVVIGYREDPTASWRDLAYVLGRFGEELLTFEELKIKAKERWKAFRSQALNETKHSAEAFLKSLDVDAEAYVNGKSINCPTFYSGF
jgi:hypothetical protein